jgi:hypothetical protein
MFQRVKPLPRGRFEPHVTTRIIVKYITELQLLGLLQGDRQNAVAGREQTEGGMLADPPGSVLQAASRYASPSEGTSRHRHLLSLPALQPSWDVF